jgi:hypothetical protein
MDKPISSLLKTTFLIHFIISLVLGLAIFIVPGRTLTLIGWVPDTVPVPNTELTVPGTIYVDAVISRLLGAATLALAFSSYLGWRARTWGQVSLIVQAEMVFCVLGAMGMIASFFLAEREIPIFGFVELVILLAFAAAWSWAFNGSRKT